MNYSIGDLMYDSETLGMIVDVDTVSVSIEWFGYRDIENLRFKTAGWRLERWRKFAMELTNEIIPR